MCSSSPCLKRLEVIGLSSRSLSAQIFTPHVTGYLCGRAEKGQPIFSIETANSASNSTTLGTEEICCITITQLSTSYRQIMVSTAYLILPGQIQEGLSLPFVSHGPGVFCGSWFTSLSL